MIVVAPGSVARTLPIPGLAEQGIGFKSIEEAIALRNQVLVRLDAPTPRATRRCGRKLLTFVFVGGGYAGIEALAELEDMASDATRYYPDVDAATCASCSSRPPAGSCPRSARTRPVHRRASC